MGCCWRQREVCRDRAWRAPVGDHQVDSSLCSWERFWLARDLANLLFSLAQERFSLVICQLGSTVTGRPPRSWAQARTGIACLLGPLVASPCWTLYPGATKGLESTFCWSVRMLCWASRGVMHPEQNWAYWDGRWAPAEVERLWTEGWSDTEIVQQSWLYLRVPWRRSCAEGSQGPAHTQDRPPAQDSQVFQVWQGAYDALIHGGGGGIT